MWAVIATIFSGLNGPIGDFFKAKAQTAMVEQQNKLEIRKAELNMAVEVAKANVEQQKNQLAATSQTFKAFSYTILTLPVIIVCVYPAWGREIFDNLSIIPVWYAQLYVAVVAVIWGLPVAANATSSIFSSIQQAWENSHKYKLNKIEALGNATAMNLEQAKKEIFDVMKQATKINGYTQAQVDLISPVLEKVLNKAGE